MSCVHRRLRLDHSHPPYQTFEPPPRPQLEARRPRCRCYCVYASGWQSCLLLQKPVNVGNFGGFI